jgi:2-octaprenyl-6-methoxyphenol hydroxylase
MAEVQADCDCVIVGAGLIGMTLALGCEALGLSTALIETRDLGPIAPPPSPVAASETRGLALAVSSRRILTGLGVWPELAPTAVPIRNIHVSDRGHFGFCRFTTADLGLDALGHVCTAATLAGALQRRVHALARCAIHSPATVTAVAPEASAITVEIATPHGSKSLSGRLLIAAAGLSTTTAALLGVTHRIHDYGRDAIVANVTVARPLPDTAFERFTRTGPIAMLPLGGTRYVSIWTLPRAQATAAVAVADDDYAAALQQSFGDWLGAISAPGPRQSFPLRLAQAGRCPTPRAVLIGNAATAVNPNAAQGLNLGLRDVAELLDHLADAGREGADPGTIATTLPQRRHSDRARVARFTDTLATLFTEEAFPLVVARDLAMLALDLLPPLKRAFLRRATGIGLTTARLARGLPPEPGDNVDER